ncbi:hypothetical protein J15TS10_46280 [Paenibacillus woosongensis]|uniref:HAMP domain-containing protein n=2 Tax=Paenibacillus woosongensis TaxID=307580 RepID=A0ABQ4MY07_9BACL|nr:hypothetical protein J15TS10_46280 [Paenibacillus woosongensis]
MMKLTGILNDIKLRNKLSLIFIAAAVIPMLISGVILTVQLREILIAGAFQQAVSNVERVRQRTEEVIKVPLDISYRLSNDSRLRTVVNREYGSNYEVVHAYKQYTDLRNYVHMYKEIQGIRLYTPNSTMLNNWDFMQPDEAIQNQPWYKQALEQRGLVGWSFMEDERDGQSYLSLVRRINLEDWLYDSVLVINVDTVLLNAILAQETFATWIVDDQNNIVAANRPDLYGKNLKEMHGDNPEMLTRSEGSFDVMLAGHPSKVVISSLSLQNSWNGLRVISVFRIPEIVKEANGVIGRAARVIAASFFAAILLVYSSASLITRRLLRLSKHMSKVGSGSWKAFLTIDGKDEIGQLSRQFNGMVERLNQLMNEVEESNYQKSLLEQKQNDIKFKMLASQINPHFLFNTLDSIRMEAHVRGQEDIAVAVWQLSSMIRSSLEIGNRAIQLREEMNIVLCYLELQKFRHEERLQYELNIEPDAEQVEILPLIIQPLVENSIIHGLENKEEGATLVQVHVYRIQEGVRIEVIDNGAGISQDKLLEIHGHLEDLEEEAADRRIGLRNVHDRLILSYGKPYGLRIDSVEGKGTSVSFLIPKEGHMHV